MNSYEKYEIPEIQRNDSEAPRLQSGTHRAVYLLFDSLSMVYI